MHFNWGFFFFFFKVSSELTVRLYVLTNWDTVTTVVMQCFQTEGSFSTCRSRMRPCLALVGSFNGKMDCLPVPTTSSQFLWCMADIVWSLFTQASSPQSPSLKPLRCDECVWLQAAHYRKPLVLVMTFCTWHQKSTKMTAAVHQSSLSDLDTAERLQQIFRLPLYELCQRSISFFFWSCR